MIEIEEAARNNMLNRLARVEGQIRGLQKLIREGKDCELVIQQMSASRKALDKAFQEMLACIIEQNILCAHNGSEPQTSSINQIKTLLTKYS
ncbi:Hypothetical protein HDN1F_14310 [gamma proteobacterium HdN1]|nr:Hypothetical protein HDN1F_14310 [gamma proteobacterium HdN1]